MTINLVCLAEDEMFYSEVCTLNYINSCAGAQQSGAHTYQVAVEMNSHMEKLRDLLGLRSLLHPLAHHGALVHSLLHSLVGPILFISTIYHTKELLTP